MAAYGGYSMPQGYDQGPPGGQPQYGQQYGQQPQYGQQQQQSYDNMSFQASAPPSITASMQHGSAPRRGSLHRSMSFDPSQSPSAAKSMALVSFDPYASTTTAPPPLGGGTTAPTAAYNNYALPQLGHTGAPPPPSFNQEEMTTSGPAAAYFNPHASAPPQYHHHQQYNNGWGHQQQHHQHHQQQQFDASASMVSDISMFTNQVAAPTPTRMAKDTETALKMAEMGDFSEQSADPQLIAEQERIWQEIQDRREMQRIRADGGVPHPRAVVPYTQGRAPPPRTRSMPMRSLQGRGQENSLASGGVAVLDPKKDKRKATRKMKTAGGAVGGAVLGGLVLGPVGVVLGSGAGATLVNKSAKSRDKRKQQEFEQKNFQKGAASSAAAKGDGAFT